MAAAKPAFGSQTPRGIPSPVLAGIPKPVAATASPGASVIPAAEDHVHAITANIITLDQLSDASTAGAVDGQFLQRQSGIWSPRTLILDDCSDVTLTSPAANNILKHDGSAWVNDGGAFTTFTPTVTQSVTITKTVNQASYSKRGRRVFGSVRFTTTSTGTFGNDLIVTYPGGFTPVDTSFGVVGSGFINNTIGGTSKPLVIVMALAAGFKFAIDAATLWNTEALVTGAIVGFHFDFEATT